MPRRSLSIQGRSRWLDARPDRLDLRDRAYLPPLGNLPPRWPKDADIERWFRDYAGAELVLDQGVEGSCTGFGLAAVINYLSFAADPDARSHRRVSPRMLYELARMYDEWPGEDYEGSSCRGALRGWRRHGVCRDSLWPHVLDSKGQSQFLRPIEDSSRRDDPERNWDVDALGCTLGVYYRVDARSVVDLQAAIRSVGAVYCSATAHEGWDLAPLASHAAPSASHEALPRIDHKPSPEKPGGHAFALVGYNESGFVVQNSWGQDWGLHGFAVLPYADWLVHGTDSWVFTLGVAQRPESQPAAGPRTARAPRHFADFAVVAPGRRSSRARRQASEVSMRAAIPAAARRDSSPHSLPAWDVDDAYAHTIVMDRGLALRTDITRASPEDAVRVAAWERPKAWLEERPAKKLLIYAHGGLNSERDSIDRIRVLAPYIARAGVYPLFLSWRSGALEATSDLIEEYFDPADSLLPERAGGLSEYVTEPWDRAFEAFARPFGTPLWGQMKANAVRASQHPQGGCRLAIEALLQLSDEIDELELHLIGHSAGSIVLGAMLRELAKSGVPGSSLKVSSLRLWAPACTVQFALEHFADLREVELDPRHFHIHVLSDANERADSVGPYRKSLLYLLSRSFEDVTGTALLGLANVFDPRAAASAAAGDLWARSEAKALQDWSAAWGQLAASGAQLRVHDEGHFRINERDASRASHGGFDNSIDIVGEALGSIQSPDSPKIFKVGDLSY